MPNDFRKVYYPDECVHPDSTQITGHSNNMAAHGQMRADAERMERLRLKHGDAAIDWMETIDHIRIKFQQNAVVLSLAHGSNIRVGQPISLGCDEATMVDQLQASVTELAIAQSRSHGVDWDWDYRKLRLQTERKFRRSPLRKKLFGAFAFSVKPIRMSYTNDVTDVYIQWTPDVRIWVPTKVTEFADMDLANMLSVVCDELNEHRKTYGECWRGPGDAWTNEAICEIISERYAAANASDSVRLSLEGSKLSVHVSWNVNRSSMFSVEIDATGAESDILEAIQTEVRLMIDDQQDRRHRTFFRRGQVAREAADQFRVIRPQLVALNNWPEPAT